MATAVAAVALTAARSRRALSANAEPIVRKFHIAFGSVLKQSIENGEQLTGVPRISACDLIMRRESMDIDAHGAAQATPAKLNAAKANHGASTTSVASKVNTPATGKTGKKRSHVRNHVDSGDEEGRVMNGAGPGNDTDDGSDSMQGIEPAVQEHASAGPKDQKTSHASIRTTKKVQDKSQSCLSTRISKFDQAGKYVVVTVNDYPSSDSGAHLGVRLIRIGDTKESTSENDDDDDDENDIQISNDEEQQDSYLIFHPDNLSINAKLETFSPPAVCDPENQVVFVGINGKGVLACHISHGLMINRSLAAKALGVDPQAGAKYISLNDAPMLWNLLPIQGASSVMALYVDGSAECITYDSASSELIRSHRIEAPFQGDSNVLVTCADLRMSESRPKDGVTAGTLAMIIYSISEQRNNLVSCSLHTDLSKKSRFYSSAFDILRILSPLDDANEEQGSSKSNVDFKVKSVKPSSKKSESTSSAAITVKVAVSPDGASVIVLWSDSCFCIYQAEPLHSQNHDKRAYSKYATKFRFALKTFVDKPKEMVVGRKRNDQLQKRLASFESSMFLLRLTNDYLAICAEDHISIWDCRFGVCHWIHRLDHGSIRDMVWSGSHSSSSQRTSGALVILPGAANSALIPPIPSCLPVDLQPLSVSLAMKNGNVGNALLKQGALESALHSAQPNVGMLAALTADGGDLQAFSRAVQTAEADDYAAYRKILNSNATSKVADLKRVLEPFLGSTKQITSEQAAKQQIGESSVTCALSNRLASAAAARCLKAIETGDIEFGQVLQQLAKLGVLSASNVAEEYAKYSVSKGAAGSSKPEPSSILRPLMSESNSFTLAIMIQHVRNLEESELVHALLYALALLKSDKMTNPLWRNPSAVEPASPVPMRQVADELIYVCFRAKYDSAKLNILLRKVAFQTVLAMLEWLTSQLESLFGCDYSGFSRVQLLRHAYCGEALPNGLDATNSQRNSKILLCCSWVEYLTSTHMASILYHETAKSLISKLHRLVSNACTACRTTAVFDGLLTQLFLEVEHVKAESGKASLPIGRKASKKRRSKQGKKASVDSDASGDDAEPSEGEKPSLAIIGADGDSSLRANPLTARNTKLFSYYVEEIVL